MEEAACMHALLAYFHTHINRSLGTKDRLFQTNSAYAYYILLLTGREKNYISGYLKKQMITFMITHDDRQNAPIYQL